MGMILTEDYDATNARALVYPERTTHVTHSQKAKLK
jgi:hypothetical protein